ncbi:hypothetical protein ACT2CV_06680 [Pasteurellaceae bacterium 22721_9_1]
MLQHATQFSFDRLKALFVLAMILAISFARAEHFIKLLFGILVCAASIQGYSSYRTDLNRYSVWSEIHYKNKLLVQAVKHSIALECSVLHSNSKVRGYLNLLWGRGIIEGSRLDKSLSLMKDLNACGSVHIQQTEPFIDLHYVHRAIVTRSDNPQVWFEQLVIGNTNNNFFLTDINWKNGVARGRAGFFVPNTNSLRTQLLPGRELVFKDGDVRTILEAVDAGGYLNIYLNGPPLDSDSVGIPTHYILRYTK